MLTNVLLAVLLSTAEAAPVRENGQIELMLSQETDDALLELELAVTDRLRLRAELPVHAWVADDVEIGLAYELSRKGRPTLVVGIDSLVTHPSELTLRLGSDIPLGRGVIHSAVKVGVGHTRDVVLELDGARDGSNWAGTLELRHDSGASELRITPGVAWKVRGVWIGMGVALPSAGTSQTSLVFKTGFDF